MSVLGESITGNAYIGNREHTCLLPGLLQSLAQEGSQWLTSVSGVRLLNYDRYVFENEVPGNEGPGYPSPR